jgi:hypothetical protein
LETVDDIIPISIFYNQITCFKDVSNPNNRVITVPEPVDPLGGGAAAAGAEGGGTTTSPIRGARPPNKVLKILQVLDREEKKLRPPDGLKRVVVLGKSFILKRDYSIWEITFGDLVRFFFVCYLYLGRICSFLI